MLQLHGTHQGRRLLLRVAGRHQLLASNAAWMRRLHVIISSRRLPQEQQMCRLLCSSAAGWACRALAVLTSTCWCLRLTRAAVAAAANTGCTPTWPLPC